MPRPESCEDCGVRGPLTLDRRTHRWVCVHRRACEARVMLQKGEGAEKAARHAQSYESERDPLVYVGIGALVVLVVWALAYGLGLIS